MNTVTIRIETAKGKTQDTTWQVWQEHPFPSISGGSHLKWENGGGIFPQYGHKAEGIGAKYKAVLLRAGFTPEDAQDNRNDYAGFRPYINGKNGDPLPGTIILRGRDMGETSAEIDRDWVRFRVTGYDTPTEGEKKFLAAQVAPHLLAYIAAHKAELYAEAVEGVKATVTRNLTEARERLVELEQEARAAIAKL